MQKTAVETPATSTQSEAVNHPLPESSLVKLEEQAALKTKIFELEDEVRLMCALVYVICVCIQHARV